MSYLKKFGPQHVGQLMASITKEHENFLEQENSDKKADALRHLAGYASQMLYLVPNDRKYKLAATSKILDHSAMHICEFDPRDASLAFEYLAKYAHNLYYQPWRQEFRKIKLNSGFFYHNIKSQLKNAEQMLSTMGYVSTDSNTVSLTRCNVENLKAASIDCFVASQECLILSQIWQRVADQEPEYPFSIGEIYEFRKKCQGDVDTICDIIIKDIRSKHQSKGISSTHFVPVSKLVDGDNELSPKLDSCINGKYGLGNHIYDSVTPENFASHGSRKQNGSNGGFSMFPYQFVNAKSFGSENSAFQTMKSQPTNQIYYSQFFNGSHPLPNYGVTTLPRGPLAACYLPPNGSFEYPEDSNFDHRPFEEMHASRVVHPDHLSHTYSTTQRFKKEKYPVKNKDKHRLSLESRIQSAARSKDAEDLLADALNYKNDVDEFRMRFSEEKIETKISGHGSGRSPMYSKNVEVDSLKTKSPSSSPYSTDLDSHCRSNDISSDDQSETPSSTFKKQPNSMNKLDPYNIRKPQVDLEFFDKANTKDPKEPISRDGSSANRGKHHKLASDKRSPAYSLNGKIQSKKDEKVKNIEESFILEPGEQKVEPWSCKHCTFRNFKEKNICEICAKSKNFVLEDDSEWTINSNVEENNNNRKQCPNCTFLTSGKLKCEMCDHILSRGDFFAIDSSV